MRGEEEKNAGCLQLCVSDCEEAGCFPISEVFTHVERYFKGPRALIFLDCCFSGTAVGTAFQRAGRVQYGVMTSQMAAQTSTGQWTFTDVSGWWITRRGHRSLFAGPAPPACSSVFRAGTDQRLWPEAGGRLERRWRAVVQRAGYVHGGADGIGGRAAFHERRHQRLPSRVRPRHVRVSGT